MSETIGIIYQTVALTNSSLLLCLITPSGKREMIVKGGQSAKNRYRAICQYLYKVNVLFENRNQLLVVKTIKALNTPLYITKSFSQVKLVSQIIKLVSSLSDINFSNLFYLLENFLYNSEITNYLVLTFYLDLTKLLGADIYEFSKTNRDLNNLLLNFHSLSPLVITRQIYNYLQSYYIDYLGIKLNFQLIDEKGIINENKK